ncbi:MAG: Rne/Rng family ribonuclease, partial [Clostridia bacterium]|nr:Rne/Rng family ribonuclease [Clostridia bacterium]
KEGDEILVQVTKLPRGNKGAKVSCALSFVGKSLIFLPVTDFLGISRKITDEESRARLLKEADHLRGEGQGYIVRTAAESLSAKRLKAESEYLKKVYRSVQEAAKTAPVGTAVYRECELPLKVMRDCMISDTDKIYVGEPSLYEKLIKLIKMRSDIGERKVVRYTGERSMFDQFGLSEQIYALANPRVSLKNGGYLVIDRTEAMTVVDVNTGKFIGESDLESTVFETNLQAAREIARQVRLRNIGGIIVVDFIDMLDPEHCAAVEAELTLALLGDRAKCRVLPMSELCLTTFTRKRTNNDLTEFLLKSCPHCTRQGFVLSDKYMAIRLRSEIMGRFADGYRAVVIELNRGLMNKILSEPYFREEVQG